MWQQGHVFSIHECSRGVRSRTVPQPSLPYVNSPKSSVGLQRGGCVLRPFMQSTRWLRR